MKKQKYPPTNIIDDINECYPLTDDIRSHLSTQDGIHSIYDIKNFWELYDEMRESKNPIAVSSRLNYIFKLPVLNTRTNSIYRIMTLGEWRYNKDAFTFPGRFWIIAKNSQDFKISNLAIKNLIGEVFYIDFEKVLSKAHGVFINILSETEVCLVVVFNNGKHSVATFQINEDTSFAEIVGGTVFKASSEETNKLLFECIKFSFYALMFLATPIIEDIQDHPDQRKKGKKKPKDIKKKVIASQLNKVNSDGSTYTIKKAHWCTYNVGEGGKKKERKFIPSKIVRVPVTAK